MAGISLRQLEVIRAVLQCGTLTEAGRTLNVSQPAISRILQHTEDLLGVPLFHRKGGRLIPTPEVRALSPDIEKVFINFDYVQRTANDITRLHRGRVRVAAIPSVAITLVANSIANFTKDKPDVSISVQTLFNQGVVDCVADRQVDFGIAFLPPEHEDVIREEIHRTRMVAVISQNHPYAKKTSITIDDLRDVPLISFSRMLPIGQLIDEQFQKAGISRRITVEVSVSFVACAMAQKGAGIALVDHLAIQKDVLPGICILPFEPAIEIPTYLLLPRGQSVSILAKAFMQKLRETADAGGFS